MRHGRGYRKLGRTEAHRKQLLRNLVSSLFLSGSGRITTTVAKAKEARRVAEKMITIGKREGVQARRLAARYLPNRKVVSRLFESIAPRYAERKGGYTRILRLGHRAGDSAEVALLELVDIAEEAHKAKREAAKDKQKKAKASEAAKESKDKGKEREDKKEKQQAAAKPKGKPAADKPRSRALGKPKARARAKSGE